MHQGLALGSEGTAIRPRLDVVDGRLARSKGWEKSEDEISMTNFFKTWNSVSLVLMSHWRSKIRAATIFMPTEIEGAGDQRDINKINIVSSF